MAARPAKGRGRRQSCSTQAVNAGTYTITNNEQERAFCEGPEFNPNLR
jgi:hypothetical protein